MLLTHQGTLRAGLAVLRRLSPAKRILLAVPLRCTCTSTTWKWCA